MANADPGNALERDLSVSHWKVAGAFTKADDKPKALDALRQVRCRADSPLPAAHLDAGGGFAKKAEGRTIACHHGVFLGPYQNIGSKESPT
jgi:hypothetical protein